MILLKLPFWDFFESIWKELWSSLEFGGGAYLVMLIWFFLAIAAVLLLIGIIWALIHDFIDKLKSTSEVLTCEVIDKVYFGERHSTGTGLTSQGGVMLTSSTSPESFLIFVKDDKGVIRKIEVNMRDYFAYEKGDKVRICVKIGGLTKEDLRVELEAR